MTAEEVIQKLLALLDCGKADEATWTLTSEEGDTSFDGEPRKYPTGYRVLAVRFHDYEPWELPDAAH